MYRLWELLGHKRDARLCRTELRKNVAKTTRTWCLSLGTTTVPLITRTQEKCLRCTLQRRRFLCTSHYFTKDPQKYPTAFHVAASEKSRPCQ